MSDRTEWEPPNNGRFARWARLTLKEMRETLRDRRTIITLVLMPLLVYPLLGVAFNKYLLTSLVKKPSAPVFRVGVESEAQKNVVGSTLIVGEAAIQLEREAHKNRVAALKGKEANRIRRMLSRTDLEKLQSRFEILVVENLNAAVASGTVDLGIRVPKASEGTMPRDMLKPNVEIPFELIRSEGSLFGGRAAVNAEVVLNAFNNYARVYRMKQVHDRVHPVVTTIEPSGSGTPFSLGALVPLILILMTITGAVYPAIDLTAGERERGTLEMLIAAPVPRMGLLLAKYATVVLVAVLTATVNLVSMTLTIFATGLSSLLFGDDGLSILVVVQVFGLMILFASFFSALLLALTSFARSFKEAQAYLIPLMLVSIAPGVFSMMPDLELKGLLVITPLANIVLLARDLFQGEVDSAAAVAVVVSTLVYALAAILAAARIFGTDAILYGSSGTWSEMFRRPEEPTPICPPFIALLTLVVAFPLCFLLNQFSTLLFLNSLPLRLGASALVTMLVFGGLPLAVAAAQNVRVRTAFSLRAPNLLAIAGAVLLGVSLWPFAFEMILAAEDWGLVSVNEELMERVGELIGELSSLPPAGVLLALAVVPAFFEEWFFRGLLLSSIRSRWNTLQAVLLSAAAFAAFHVIIQHQLAFERFLPSFLLGVVLGWVCLRTGSLWPGILLHACHNGLLISLLYYKETLESWGVGVSEDRHLPWTWLLAAGVIAAFGFGAVGKPAERASMQERSENDEPLAATSSQEAGS